MHRSQTAAIALVAAALSFAAIGCDEKPPDRADASENSTTSAENGEGGTSTESDDSTGDADDPGSEDSKTSDAATDETDARDSECVRECVQSRQMQSEPIEKIRRECEQDCREEGD